jgi:hypothetical protein
MKKTFLIIMVFFVSMNAMPQVKFGLVAGIGSQTIKPTEIKDNNLTVNSLSDPQLTYHLGLSGQLSLLGILGRVEAYVSGTQIKFTITDKTTDKDTDKSQHDFRFNVPILVGYKLGPARLFLGPIASFKLNKSSDLIEDQVSGYTNKASFGYQLGVGLDIWKIGADIRYEGNIGNIEDKVNIAGKKYNMDTRPNQWLFNLSYYF